VPHFEARAQWKPRSGAPSADLQAGFERPAEHHAIFTLLQTSFMRGDAIGRLPGWLVRGARGTVTVCDGPVTGVAAGCADLDPIIIVNR